MIIKVVIIIGVLVVVSLGVWLSVGGVTSKSYKGYIANIEYSSVDNGSIIYFQDGEVIKAQNRFSHNVTINPKREYRITYKEIKGGLIVKHSIYLDKLYALSMLSEGEFRELK